MPTDERYKFFAARYGPVAAMRAVARGTAVGALGRHDAWTILRDLAGDGRLGERRHLLALSELVESGLDVARVPSARLLDGLLGAVDRGTLILQRGWNGSASEEEQVEHDADQELATRAMGKATELTLDGEHYVIKTAAAWNEPSERQAFELLRPDLARRVLERMAALPRWSKEQKAALEEVAANLHDQAPEGLVLLRRQTFNAPWTDEPAEVTTPSRAKPREEVESVNPVMDGSTVELDTSDAELPAAPEQSEGGGDAEPEDAESGPPDGAGGSSNGGPG